jgi:hypothetical protein
MYMFSVNEVPVPILEKHVSTQYKVYVQNHMCTFYDVRTFWEKLKLIREEQDKPAAIHCPLAVPVSYAATPAHWHGTPLARCTVRAFQLCKLHIQVV